MKTTPTLHDRARRNLFVRLARFTFALVALQSLSSLSVLSQELRDFGDAPRIYPQAAHALVQGFFLGARVDAESSTQFSNDATGDDNAPVGAADDEDGITWGTNPLVPGQTASIRVVLNGPNGGRLDAWIDFNADGDWVDAGEQIFQSRFLQHGVNNLSFAVPGGALPNANTFARFRVSFEGGLPPGPLANNQVPPGEVEDYQVPIAGEKPQLDFGDAPEKYPVVISQNGASHVIIKGFNLGERIDAEENGQPSSTALGDDQNPATADDEDGVRFLTALIPGNKARVEVIATAPQGGRLDAWIDFNQDSDWLDAGERIFSGQFIASGVNTLDFDVPQDAFDGVTFARFRLSFEGGLPPTGPASDGEVEDYSVVLESSDLDFGDAPQSYPVMLSQDGARHRVTRGIHLGFDIDAERDGQPSTLANADDLAVAGGPRDDEDGVMFTTHPLIAGSTAQVAVIASTGEARLDAWVDFNGDGDWNDAGEQIFTARVLSFGTNNLSFAVPANAVLRETFARFRLSWEGGLKPQGPAPDGEVEDYQVKIEAQQLDFGDAPQNYPVMLSQNGARHSFLRDFHLGLRMDVEADGQPSSAANADDLNPSTADDEDGVTFPGGSFTPGAAQSIQVSASSSGGILQGWIDWNHDGDWADAGEHVIIDRVLASGVNPLSISVPANAIEGETFARFRLSRERGLSFTGFGGEGEVEDYRVHIERQMDFGDAFDLPTSPVHPTLLVHDGARHVISRGFHLGKTVDAEPDGQPGFGGDGDDIHPAGAADDEDGVTLLAPMQQGAVATVQVTMEGGEGRLDAWIDFNRNRSWNDAGEQIFTSHPVSTGANNLTFTVPSGAVVANDLYVRFRLSRQGGLRPSGLAPDGEVEDYLWEITRRPDVPCDDRTHRGTNFWITFPGNYDPDPDNRVNLRLFIVGQRETTGTVNIPGLGFSTNYTIPASRQFIVVLPRDAELGEANDVIEKKGIHVTADREVAVYGLNKVWWTTDGYLALPTDVIGGRYVVQGYGNEFTGVPDLNGTQFALVATEDGTTVSITPSVSTLGHPANASFSIMLNQGETYQLRNTNDFNNDLSGTQIQANKRISVFGSHQTANVPSDDVFFADHLVEQLLPVERAGVYFVALPFETRSGDTFRFTATTDNTDVQVNGAIVATLDAGQRHEMIISNASRILASKPIFVTQYANSSDFDGVVNSDPAMANVPPISMFLNDHLVTAANYGFTDHYVNIVAPTAVVGSLILDGAAIPAASFTAIPLTPFSGARIKVTPGVHSLFASQPFGVTVYGWAEYESYAYPGGLFFGDTQPPQLTCPEDIQVTLQPGSTQFPCSVPVPDLREQVEVSDNCGLPTRSEIFQTPAPGTLVGPGKHVITLGAFDSRGNLGICEVVFDVIDPTPLRLQCPGDITAVCNTEGGAIVQYQVRATRACGPVDEPKVICEPPPGSVFPVGTTTVNCSVTDPVTGEKLTCSFKVTVACNGGGTRITPTIGANGALTLSWTGNATLQTSTDLMRWSNVPVDNNSYQVDPRSSAKAFYRLLIEED